MCLKCSGTLWVQLSQVFCMGLVWISVQAVSTCADAMCLKFTAHDPQWAAHMYVLITYKLPHTHQAGSLRSEQS